MINPPEMPINDEARNEAHIASTGVRLYPVPYQPNSGLPPKCLQGTP